MSSDIPKKRVLLIEDNQEIVGSLSEVIARDAPEVELSIARNIHKAQSLLKSDTFDALIVDLMLPANQTDLEEVERLAGERTDLLRLLAQQTGYGTSQLDRPTATLRRAIKELDDRIEKRLRLEGGCEILEEHARRLPPVGPGGELQLLEIPVLFLTARGLPEVKERCERIVHEDFLHWFEKPTEETAVVRVLRKVLGIQLG